MTLLHVRKEALITFQSKERRRFERSTRKLNGRYLPFSGALRKAIKRTIGNARCEVGALRCTIYGRTEPRAMYARLVMSTQKPISPKSGALRDF